jgi:DNA-binding helix-turn-helix protein
MTRKRRPHTGPGLSFDEVLGLTLNQYMLVGGITRARLGEILGVAGSNISQRIRGRATWSAEDLVAVANIFGVTTDTLVPSKTTDGWVPAPYVPGTQKAPAPVEPVSPHSNIP